MDDCVSWSETTVSISIRWACENTFNANFGEFFLTFVVEDAFGVFECSAFWGLNSFVQFVVWDVFSYANVTFNAEVSDSLGVNSLFTVGLVACAAVGVAVCFLFNIWGGWERCQLVNAGLERGGCLHGVVQFGEGFTTVAPWDVSFDSIKINGISFSLCYSAFFLVHLS